MARFWIGLVCAISLLLAACSSAELSESVSCTKRDLHFLCSGDGLQYLVSDPAESATPHGLVIVDPGGPGFDVLGEARPTFEALKVLWPSARLVLLVEPWQWEPVSGTCTDQLSAYIEMVRLDIQPTEPQAECIEARWSSDTLATAYKAIITKERIEETSTLLVGLSFGAHRIAPIIDELAVLDDQVSILLDSPPEIGTTDAKKHFDSRVARIGHLMDATPGVEYDTLLDWAGAVIPTDTDTDARSTFLSRHDPAASLLLLAQNLPQNETFLSDLADTKVTSVSPKEMDVSMSRAADNFFRRTTGGRYDSSWAGYFAEFCPTFSEWPQATEDDDPLLELLVELHQVCELANFSDEGRSPDRDISLDVCVIERDRDPNGPLIDNDWLLSPRVMHATIEGGHRPLTGLFSRSIIDEYQANSICESARTSSS